MERSKSKFESVGNANHCCLDNIWTLMNSNSDLYDGVISYIFFEVLNCTPVEYANLTPMIFEEELSEREINNLEKNHLRFKNQNKYSNKIKSDIIKIITYVRKEALQAGIIEETIIKDKYVEKTTGFNANYIIKKMITFYNKNKGMVI